MVNQQLLDCIKQQLAVGHDRQAVKDALLNAGWGEQDVNEAFKSVQQPFAPSQTSVAEPGIESVFLGPTKLLGNAWALYKQRFWTLIAIALIPILVIIPVTIGGSLISAFVFSKIIAGGSLSLILIMFVFAVLVMFLVQLWGQTALMFAIVNSKEGMGFVESFRRGWRKILSLWWVAVLMAFVTLGGFLLAIIPGIIFTVWFILSTWVLIAEDSRGMDALLKSREYVRGRWWAVLGRNIFIGLFYFVVFLIPTLIFLFIFKAPLASQVINFVIILTLVPLALIYMFMMYQNLRSLRGEIDLAPARKSRIAFFVIAALGIVAIFALLFWTVFPTFSTLRQLGNYTQTFPTPTLTPTQNNEIANWQTYTDQSLGFEFKYPSSVKAGIPVDYTSGQQPDVAYFQTLEYSGKEAQYGTPEFKNGMYARILAFSNPQNLNLSDFVKIKYKDYQIAQTSTTINGNTAVIVVWPPKGAEGEAPYPIMSYFFKNNSKVFEIDGMTNYKPATITHINLYLQVVSTFITK